MKSNWFAVNREFTSDKRWLSEPFTKGQAWIDLIGLARHTAGFMNLHKGSLWLERGQLAWSDAGLVARWQWSRNKVRKFMISLENDGLITRHQQIVKAQKEGQKQVHEKVQDLVQMQVQVKKSVSSVTTILCYDTQQGKGTDEGTDAGTGKGTGEGG